MSVTSLADRRVRAWDLPTRLFKWTLVALVVAAPLTVWYGDAMLFWHRLVGYAILTLLAWRVLWGFAGGTTSRWRSFLKWPWTAARYGFDLILGRKRHHLGHNPLGTWMVVSLLILLAAQVVTGLFSTDDVITDGPFRYLVSYESAKALTQLHDRISQALLAFVVIHVLVNVVYTLRGDHLIGAMLTGMKPAGAYEDAEENRDGSLLLAFALLLVAAAIVFGALILFGRTPFA